MRSPLLDIDLRPFFLDAASALGLIREDSIDWFVAKAHTPSGLWRGPEAIRRDWGHGWISTLTERGMLDPVSSFDDSYWHAISNARRAQRFRKEATILTRGVSDGRFFPAALLTVSAVPEGYCSSSDAMGNKLLSHHPELPWPGCQQRVCRCSWRLVSRTELESLLISGQVEDLRHG